MELSEKVWLATKCIYKNWDYEKFKYGDDLFHLEGYELDDTADEIWDLVEEYLDYGRTNFEKKYEEYKIYGK